MATPKRNTGRYFKGIQCPLYQYDFPSLESAKEYVKKYGWSSDRVHYVKRYRRRSLPVWDVYVRELEDESEMNEK